jgi:hypothetical protein
MAYFSDSVDKHLINWVNKDTWHTGHPYDDERFYKFVEALMKSGYMLDEPELRVRITRAIRSFHPQHNDDDVKRRVEIARGRIVTVYDYLRACGE